LLRLGPCLGSAHDARRRHTLRVETGDPTWYLIGDLVCTGLSAIATLAATGVAVTLAVRAARDQRMLREEHHSPLPTTG
jgi:hypothetical protein